MEPVLSHPVSRSRTAMRYQVRLVCFAITIFIFPPALIAQPFNELPILRKNLQNAKSDTARVSALDALARHYVNRPGEYKKDLDSAKWYLRQAEMLALSTNSGQHKGYTQLVASHVYREGGEKDKGRPHIDMAILLLQKAQQWQYLGEAYDEKARYYTLDADEIGKKTETVQRSIECYNRAGDAEREIGARFLLADLYSLQSLDTPALYELFRSLELSRRIGKKNVQGIYDLLGSVYFTLENFKEAYKYGTLALETAVAVGDTSLQLCTIHNRLGSTCIVLLDLAKGEYHLRKALSIAEKYNDALSIYLIAFNLLSPFNDLVTASEGLTEMNTLVSKYPVPDDKRVWHGIQYSYLIFYTQLGMLDKARPYYDTLSDIVQSGTMSSYLMGYSYVILIQYLVASKQFTQAEYYLDKHKELAYQNADLRGKGESEDLWFTLDTARGNYKAAVYHLLRSRDIYDSIFDENKMKQIRDLQVQYQTEGKEKNIQILTAQNKLQQNEIKTAATMRNTVLVLSGLLLVIIALLYSRYRIKQRTSKELDRKNHDLEHLLQEKEMLMKEIHHRVKNNLQTIISLLETQSAYLKDEARDAIQKSQDRVYAMSLIHQKLYQSDNITTVDMAVYLPDLVQHLRQSFEAGDRIRFSIDIQHIRLDVAQAIPVGLILNEAITNAIKYAFPDGRSGMVDIKMVRTGNNRILLTVADNGIGFTFDKEKVYTGAFGLKLMSGLSEEIGAVFTIDHNNGTKISVLFEQDAILQNNHK